MYQLLVTAEAEAWEGKDHVFGFGRFLEHTSKDLREAFLPLDGTRIAKLLEVPALFAYESGTEGLARIGKIISVKTRGSLIRLTYAFDTSLAPLEPRILEDLAWDLDIDTNEMSRTHWALKEPDLLGVLKQSGHLGIGGVAVPPPVLRQTSAVVDRALRDAEALLQAVGPSSTIDRVHTALQGYLLEVCKNGGLTPAPDASLPSLLKLVRTEHPAFQADSVRRKDISTLLRTMGSVVDTLGTLRNNASSAHPSEQVLDDAEALLAIHAARTLLHYLDSRLAKHRATEPGEG